MTLDARELTQEVLQKSKWQNRLFKQELQKCMTYIKETHKYQKGNATIHNVPLSLLGEPVYDWEECVKYVKRKLIQNNFYVRTCLPGNRLFISWDPKHVAQVPHLQKLNNIEPPRTPSPPPRSPSPVIEYIPSTSRRRSHDEFRKQVMQDISLEPHRKRSKKRSHQFKIRRR